MRTPLNVAVEAARLTQNQREFLISCARARGKRQFGLYGYKKPDSYQSVGAAAMYRRGLLIRERAMETDRFRGNPNNSDRARWFWAYDLTGYGRDVAAALITA